MSSELWIVEQDLCRCCHAQGVFNNLAEPRGRSSQKEIYYDMLKDSLGISIDPVLGVLSEVTYTICEACILRLKDAFEFKKQVRKCEEKFKDFCNRNAIKVASEKSDNLAYNLDIKIELPESLSDFKVDSFDDDDDDDDDNKFDIFENFKSKDQIKSDTSPKPDSGSKQKSINTTKNKAKTKLEQSEENQSVKKEEAVDEKKKSENKSAEKKNSMDDWFDDDDDDDDDDGFDFFDNFDNEDQIKKDTSPTPDSGSKQKGKNTKTKAKTKSEQKKGKQSVEEEAADGKKKTANKSAEKKGALSTIRFRQLWRDYKKVGDTYTCNFCDKIYKGCSTLRTHLLYEHHKFPRYSCELCKKEFKTLKPFTLHKLEAHNIDDFFKCNACEMRKFVTEKQLRNHINIFHMMGVKKHKCKDCDFETLSLTNLKKHIVKHKTVKDYCCSYCKKSFLRKSNMLLHEKIHTGDKTKVCKVCDQAFVQKASLNYHMIKHHPAVHF